MYENMKTSILLQLIIHASNFLSGLSNILDSDDYYPQSIKKVSTRRDVWTNEPVSRGKLELLGGVSREFTFRTKPKPHRVHVEDLKKILQCAPREPTLDGSRGSVGLLKLIVPTKQTIEHICASIESGCTPLYKCRSFAADYRAGKYPTGHGHEGDSSRNLLRIIDNDIYFDWPWGIERFKTNPYPSMTAVLFHLLDISYGLPDSVFIMAAEQSFNNWNIPFPALSNSPSFKSSDIPWPWVESLRVEVDLHHAAAENRNFSGNFFHARFTKQVEWNQRIPKALYLGEIIVSMYTSFIFKLVFLDIYNRFISPNFSVFDRLFSIKHCVDLT